MLEHRHGVYGGDLDFPAKRQGIEGVLNILNRRDQLRNQALVAESQDLVADGDEDDVARRVERGHVGSNPALGETRVGCETRDVAVRRSDDDTQAGVR